MFYAMERHHDQTVLYLTDADVNPASHQKACRYEYATDSGLNAIQPDSFSYDIMAAIVTADLVIYIGQFGTKILKTRANVKTNKDEIQTRTHDARNGDGT